MPCPHKDGDSHPGEFFKLIEGSDGHRGCICCSLRTFCESGDQRQLSDWPAGGSSEGHTGKRRVGQNVCLVLYHLTGKTQTNILVIPVYDDKSWHKALRWMLDLVWPYRWKVLCVLGHRQSCELGVSGNISQPQFLQLRENKLTGTLPEDCQPHS